MAEGLLLEMSNISKSFPGVKALDDMHFDLRSGELHALLGENGAGKSTLIKILSGICKRDSGIIKINGRERGFNSVAEVTADGIRTIHQELVLVPNLSIAENIYLGNEISIGGIINMDAMITESQDMLDRFGMNLKSTSLISSLTIAQQQMVEIVKAVSFHGKIIIMDEPTSALSNKEMDALFDCIRNLKKQGMGVIYISHRMSELFEIADRVTVMRDGKYIDTKNISETNVDELVSLMVGRTIENYYTRGFEPTGETVLEVKGLTNKSIHNVSFELKKGEILGFAGLVGAGRTETLQAIFGIDRVQSGTVKLNGKEIKVKKAADAIKMGMSLVPESRKDQALFPSLSIRMNITLKVLKEFIRGVFVNSRKEETIAEKQIDNLGVKAPSLNMQLMFLSGGNQQKVIIGSWLATKPKVLLMDEPTRGIDVGAKTEIYEIMNHLTKQGVSIIMVSSELPEVINMSDRVVVMRKGEVSAILEHGNITQEKIMKYAVTI